MFVEKTITLLTTFLTLGTRCPFSVYNFPIFNPLFAY
ncbi:hypothetical protein LINGRAHAP2_LOCUS36915 [Linum grandiflorum]